MNHLLRNIKIAFLGGLALFIMPQMSLAKDHIVYIVSDYDQMRMVFEPKILKINLGDKVTWINEADEIHNMMTYPDGYPAGGQGFTSPYLEKKNDQWSHIFNQAQGVYEYHCIPHIMMGMRGKILVGDHHKNTKMNQPNAQEIKVYRDEILKFFDEEDLKDMPPNVSKQF